MDPIHSGGPKCEGWQGQRLIGEQRRQPLRLLHRWSYRSWANSGGSHSPPHVEKSPPPRSRIYLVKVLEQLTARLYGSPMSETSRLPKPVATNWEWQYEGACRSLPTEMFFHPDGERGPRRKARENAAKAVCASCPVIAACRAHALAAQEPYGIWGGLTEEERLDIISKAQRQQRFFTA